MQKTLVIVEPGIKLWGSERALLTTLPSLCACWDRIVLVTAEEAELAEEIASNEQYDHIELRHIPIGNLHKRRRSARLVAAILLFFICLRERASRVYLNQAGLFRVVQPIALCLRLPFVVHVRLIEDVPRVAKMRGSRHSPVQLIFVSGSMAESFEVPRNHYVQCRVSYDPYLFRSSTSDQVPERDFVCVGRLSERKGQHLLVEAMAHPAVSKSGATLDFFGMGIAGDPYAHVLQARAQASETVGRINWHGFREDVLSHLSKFRFLVAPSRYESLGRVVIEAWEAGIVPIVYADSGGAAEIVHASRGGLTFSEWTPEALAVTLAAALALSDDEYDEMAANGRRWGQEVLAIENYRAELDGVLYPPFD